MMNTIDNYLKNTRTLAIITILLLATISWVSHFWYVDDFGLYEDDHWFIANSISRDLNGLIDAIKDLWIKFQQGRSLGFTIGEILAFTGFQIGGLSGVYFLGYLVFLTNTLLFHYLMFRLSKSQAFSLIASLAFCLFPADTTSAFLTHNLLVYPCITFCLLATHAYISNRQWLAYLSIAASLICYETAFLVFLPVPLLSRQNESKLVKKLLHHAFFMALILAASILLRKLVGESRISELTPLTAAGTAIVHTIFGPFIGLWMYIYRPIYTLINWPQNSTFFVLFFNVIIGLLVWKTQVSKDSYRLVDNKTTLISYRQLLLVGVVMLILAYPLTMIVGPEIIDGRGSRSHLAARIGGSIVFAVACHRLLSIPKNIFQTIFASVVISTIFSLLLGFGLIVQQDYSLAWKKQQIFWTDVVKLCPDMKEGTTLLIEEKDLYNPTQIQSYSWSTKVVLEHLYDFPKQWKIVPHLYTIHPHWQDLIKDPNQLPLEKITEWPGWLPKQHPGIVKAQEVIMLKMTDDRLTRLDNLLLKNGIALKFKDYNPTNQLKFPTRPLYPYLITPPTKI